jgi:pimeloyl-ACP methyl ester carboxylesterase/DNA-binding CsgD family transcriptional regulator
MTKGQDSQNIIELIYGAATNGQLYLELVESLKKNIDHQEDLTSVASLLSHLKQSSEISQQFFETQQQQLMYNTLVEQLPYSILLLDEEANIIFANESAFKAAKITHVNQLPKTLALDSKTQDTLVKKHVKNMASHQLNETKAMLLEVQGDGDKDVSLLAMLSPITQVKGMYNGHIPSGAVAALFISQQPNVPIQFEQLQSLYHLTPTEAFIAGKLASAYSTEDIAKMRNSTVATIRNYIKSILQKTQTSKQQELVSLLLRSPLSLNTSFTKSLQKNAQLIGQDYLLELKDKRQLSYRVYGDLRNTPIIQSHASLSCRLEATLYMEAVLAQGFCVIVPERAGFGLSSLPPYQSLLDYPDDIVQLLDGLNIDAAYFLGTLAGGCFTLAMAYAHPERVKEVMLIESFSPFVEPAKVKGAPFFYRHFPQFCQSWPRLALYAMRLSMFEFKRKPDESYRHLLGLFNEVDAKNLALAEVKSPVKLQAIESTRQGVEALLQDIVLTTQEWGFDISQIQSPCHIFYGEADPVAAQFSKELQTLLPNAVGHFYEHEGFASMMYLKLPKLVHSLNWQKQSQLKRA